MKYLLGLLILLNIADSVLTHFIVQTGVGREGNPFLLSLVGQPAFFAIKVAGVFLCALILWDISRRYRKLAFMATAIFVSAYTGIVMWNTSLLLS